MSRIPSGEFWILARVDFGPYHSGAEFLYRMPCKAHDGQTTNLILNAKKYSSAEAAEAERRNITGRFAYNHGGVLGLNHSWAVVRCQGDGMLDLWEEQAANEEKWALPWPKDFYPNSNSATPGYGHRQAAKRIREILGKAGRK